MAAEKPALPKEYVIDETVSVFVGYADGRMKIEFDTGLPLVGRVKAWLTPDGIPAAKRAVLAQEEWLAKPESLRKMIGAKP